MHRRQAALSGATPHGSARFGCILAPPFLHGGGHEIHQQEDAERQHHEVGHRGEGLHLAQRPHLRLRNLPDQLRPERGAPFGGDPGDVPPALEEFLDRLRPFDFPPQGDGIPFLEEFFSGDIPLREFFEGSQARYFCFTFLFISK